MKLLASAGLLAAMALSACAPGPNAVAPAAIPGGTYSNLSCKAAQTEYQRVTAEVTALSTKQQNAAAADAIGVFLVLVPVSSLTGGNVQGDLATAKGKKLALESRLSSC